MKSMNNYPRLVIAGLRGGSGKTIISIGLARAWKNMGLKVAPFKKGPDYIDAGWLASASQRPCYNLDPFLIGKEHLLSSFISHSEGSDISIIEGSRGLFDGMDEAGTYSTAEVAKTLQAPVILVMDCTKVTRTLAAVLLGIQTFDKKLRLKGVILNRIAGSRHEAVILQALAGYTDIPVFGAIPLMDEDVFPMRHLGLTPFQEHPQVEQAIEKTTAIISSRLDMDKLLGLGQEAKGLRQEARGGGKRIDLLPIAHSLSPVVKIGVIKDSAFQFYYQENIEALQRHGAEILEISSIAMPQLPDIDALYIGGGFPETHALALAENEGFRNSLNSAIRRGLPVYAECGGLMYLGESLLLDNMEYPMAGIFPISFSLEKRPQAYGYSIAEVVYKNPFFPEGLTLRGHEFHYSRPVFGAGAAGFHYALRIKRGKGLYEGMDGICYKNVFATYTHLHALGAKEWAEGIIKQARKYKTIKSS